MTLRKIAGLGALLSLVMPGLALAEEAAAPALNSGDTAWMLTSTALVLFMTIPGLALFYGGMVRSKNVLSVMMQCFAITALMTVLWTIYGYSMAFDTTGMTKEAINLYTFVGGLGKAFLSGISRDSLTATIPETLFVTFQMTFAIITPALIVGAFAERMKFSAMLLFMAIWFTVVYAPVAHMVWGGNGALMWDWGVLDFAGGTVVHINAGVSALVGAMLLGPRIGYKKEIMAPHSLTMTLIGTGLLWVGWFGFNAGSALEANGSAGLALINTFVATAAGVLFWMLTERLLGHKASMLGACSGAIAGLVAVTPAAGNALPFGALALGAVASVICAYFVVAIKPKLKLDDSLDAFGIHGIGGIVGSIGTAFTYIQLAGDDYDLGAQLMTQVIAVAIAIVWAAVGSFIAFSIAKLITGLRVTEEVERMGLDLGEHGERAYNY